MTAVIGRAAHRPRKATTAVVKTPATPTTAVVNATPVPAGTTPPTPAAPLPNGNAPTTPLTAVSAEPVTAVTTPPTESASPIPNGIAPPEQTRQQRAANNARRHGSGLVDGLTGEPLPAGSGDFLVAGVVDRSIIAAGRVTITFDAWRRMTGYDPATRTYRRDETIAALPVTAVTALPTDLEAAS